MGHASGDRLTAFRALVRTVLPACLFAADADIDRALNDVLFGVSFDDLPSDRLGPLADVVAVRLRRVL